ncbi:MAG: ABC transporter ATP-binding protein, partial [Oscillospiraceae bacterium]
MFKLVKYLKKYKKEAILGPLFKLIEAVLELIVPLVMANIIDIGVNKLQSTEYVIWGGLLMIFLGALGLGFALICQYFGSKASQGVGTQLRTDLYSHINTLSFKELDSIGSSSLITRLTNDINQIQVAVAMAIRLLTRAPFLVIGAAIMAMTIDLQLSLIFLVIIPLVSIVLYLVMSKSIPYFKSIQKTLDKLMRISSENVEGARVVKAFTKEEYEKQRFKNANEELAKESIKVGKISAILNPATFLILNLAIIAIVWFGGIGVDNGRLTQGQIIAFVNYITQILLALIVVANLAARINEVFEIKSSLNNGVINEIIPVKKGDTIIKFSNVSFAYHKNKYVLQNIDFSVNKGDSIGIIGSTGSGKSTILNLISRFYDVSKGEIIIFDKNIKNYTFKAIRENITCVFQNPMLFKGTIRSNLSLGKNITENNLISALKTAQAYDFVYALDGFLDAPVTSGGKNFSGGQKQRLTIARALSQNPQILILDDASSALDYSTDAKLRSEILNLTKEKELTVIIISQRINTIKHCDNIIVLDDRFGSDPRTKIL